MNYTITSAYLTEYYDNDETRETEVTFPETATLEILIEKARKICEEEQVFNEYFNGMKMNETPDVCNRAKEDGYIDISFEFSNNDFRTDMRVSYTVEENA